MTSQTPLRHAAPLLLLGAALLSCSDGTGPEFDALVITTETLPPAVRGEAYAAGVNAEGGDESYSWQLVQGELPEGLELNVEGLTDDDLLVRGTPVRLESRTFTVQVQSGDGQTATHEYTVSVIQDPIANVALPPGLVDFPYSVVLRSASGITVESWELAEGTLPPGLSLTDGRITGTPTAPDTADLVIRLVAAELTVEKAFRLQVVPDRPDDYHVTVFEVVPVPGDIRPHLDAAVAGWEAILESDFPSGTIGESQFPARVCGGYGEDINGGALDDMLLLVNIEPIDGRGKVLGQAGPCLFQEDTLIPGAGILTLDVHDLEPLVGTETLTYIIFHEIGHVLGFGGLWDPDPDFLASYGRESLVEGAGTSDPRFIGEQAVAEWQALGGTGGVPIETEGGQGTAEVHWAEDPFDRERMTGFSEGVGVSQPMSRVSVASMADLGYEVDLTVADPFTLLLTLRAHGDEADLFGTAGHDILYTGPVGTLDFDRN